MKTTLKIMFLLVLAAVLTTNLRAQMIPSPPLFTGSLTNGETVTTYSNGIAVGTATIQPHRHLVDKDGDVVPDAMLALISANTGIPESLLKIVPPKVIFWAALIYFGYPTVARKLRKILPDAWQTGDFGVILANLADEINPSKAKLQVAAAARALTPVATQASVPPVTQTKTP